MAAECTRTGSTKLLVEEDIGEIVSLNEMYKIASEVATFGFSGVCVAFVDRYAQHKELNEFGELVATNRGMFGRIFDNFEEGEAWLLGQ